MCSRPRAREDFRIGNRSTNGGTSPGPSNGVLPTSYLVKPFRAAALKTKIQNIFESQKNGIQS